MGERFYLAQLANTGSCPGHNNTRKRRKAVAWSDEKRKQAVEMYENAEPTAENSIEVVKEIAEEIGEAPNGVRMVLVKAGVYIKKEPAAEAKPSSSSKGGSSRVSKTEAIERLKTAIEDSGSEVDEDIVSKLTGKAAQYLSAIIEKLNS